MMGTVQYVCKQVVVSFVYEMIGTTRNLSSVHHPTIIHCLATHLISLTSLYLKHVTAGQISSYSQEGQLLYLSRIQKH